MIVGLIFKIHVPYLYTRSLVRLSLNVTLFLHTKDAIIDQSRNEDSERTNSSRTLGTLITRTKSSLTFLTKGLIENPLT